MAKSSKLFKSLVAGVKTFTPSCKENSKEHRDKRKGRKQRCLWCLRKSPSRNRGVVVTVPLPDDVIMQKETDTPPLLIPPSLLLTGNPSAVPSPSSKDNVTEHHIQAAPSDEITHVEISDPEQRAALKIQAAFRCYLARRAYHALKALVRIQALVRGRRTRKHAAVTLRCIRALVRVQALARSRRIRKSELGELVQRHLQQAKQHRRKSGEGGTTSSAYALTKSQSRQDAVLKRDRALVYALCEQLHRPPFKTSSSNFQPGKGQWAWFWLELWTTAHFSGIRATEEASGHQDLMAYDIVEIKEKSMDGVRQSQAAIGNETQHAEGVATEGQKNQGEVFICGKDVSSCNGDGIVEGEGFCSGISLTKKNGHEAEEEEMPEDIKDKESMKALLELEMSRGKGVKGDVAADSGMYNNVKRGEDRMNSPTEREEPTVNSYNKKAQIQPPAVDPIPGAAAKPSSAASSMESHDDILSGVNLKPVVTATTQSVSTMDKIQRIPSSKTRPTVLELMNSSSEALAVSPARFESPAKQQSPTPSSAFSLVGCYSAPASPTSLSLEEQASPERLYGTTTSPSGSVAYEMQVAQEMVPSMNGDSRHKSDEEGGTGNEDEEASTFCITFPPANGSQELIVTGERDASPVAATVHALIDQRSDMRAKQESPSPSPNQEHSTPVSNSKLSEQHTNQGQKQQAEQISPSVPNYMATTKSSMAKARSSIGGTKQKQEPSRQLQFRMDSPGQQQKKKQSPKMMKGGETGGKAESSPSVARTDSPKPLMKGERRAIGGGARRKVSVTGMEGEGGMEEEEEEEECGRNGGTAAAALGKEFSEVKAEGGGLKIKNKNKNKKMSTTTKKKNQPTRKSSSLQDDDEDEEDEKEAARIIIT